MPQTIAPATASSTKWFAVAIIATRIMAGYANPAIRQASLLGLGSLSLMVLLRVTRKERVLERRCCGASGILMIVNPMRREYPKCKEGIAAY
jgi:hypothetical protein